MTVETRSDSGCRKPAGGPCGEGNNCVCVRGEVCVSGMCVWLCWFVCSVCGVGEMYMYIVCLCAVCLWCV